MMMTQAVKDLNRAKGRMAGDFRTMIADGEDLLKAAATATGEGFAAARTKFEGGLENAKATLVDASQPAFDKARESAAATDQYVQSNPWTAVGLGIAAGMLIGFLAAKR